VCLGVYRGGEFADELDSVIQEVCAANGGSFIQTQDLFTTNAFVAAEGFPAYPRVGDGGHPNDDGHAAMAGRILRTLTGA
jgi:lysophospholipase L1-like esterase